jgi:hypothetical protein
MENVEEVFFVDILPQFSYIKTEFFRHRNKFTLLWRGGRVAEGNGLLNRHSGLTAIESSNLSLSAKVISNHGMTFLFS